MPAKLHRLVREPLASDGAAPLLVLLHGLGSDERDLMELASELDSRLRVVMLRAPHQWNQGGYAWFNLDWDFRGIRIDPAEVVDSLRGLTDEIESLRAELRPSQLILGGFSQGAIMAMGVAARRPELLTGVILLSGRFVPETFAEAAPGVAGLPVLIQHGEFDPVLEVTGARSLRDALLKLGANVEYHEYPMGHEVNWNSLSDTKKWISNQLLNT